MTDRKDDPGADALTPDEWYGLGLLVGPGLAGSRLDPLLTIDQLRRLLTMGQQCRRMLNDQCRQSYPFEVRDVVESGEDGGDFMGYFAKGHIGKRLFANACNERSMDYGRWDEVREEDVLHGWWRNVPIAGEPGFWQFLPAEPGSRGAYMVTHVDPGQRPRRRLDAHYRRGERAGHARGYSDSLDAFWEIINRECGFEPASRVIKLIREREKELAAAFGKVEAA